MRIAATLVVVVGLLLASTALAQRGGGSSCSLVVWPINFGTYNVFGTAPTDAAASVSFNCHQAKNIQITLSAGNLGTFARCDTGCGANQLSYNIYLDAARTVIWGDQAHWTLYSRRNPPDGTWVYVTAYGRIPAGQDVVAGSYSDSIVVTAIF